MFSPVSPQVKPSLKFTKEKTRREVTPRLMPLGAALAPLEQGRRWQAGRCLRQGLAGDPASALEGGSRREKAYLPGSDGPCSPACTAGRRSPSGSRSLRASARPGCRSAGGHRLGSFTSGGLEPGASSLLPSPQSAANSCEREPPPDNRQAGKGLHALWSGTRDFHLLSRSMPTPRAEQRPGFQARWEEPYATAQDWDSMKLRCHLVATTQPQCGVALPLTL